MEVLLVLVVLVLVVVVGRERRKPLPVAVSPLLQFTTHLLMTEGRVQESKSASGISVIY